MKKRNNLFILILMLTISLILVACGGDSKEEGDKDKNEEKKDKNFTSAMVTDVGGVDDKSFNQSAWEGLKAWGEENKLEKGTDGFDYAQSADDSEYLPNLTRLVRNDFDIIFGIGFLLQDSMEEIAKQNPDNNFAIVDTVAEGDNIASITFAEHDGSFLVGVAAAMKTESDHLGFIGGVDSVLINKFEAGFVAGAKSINPDIKIDIQYAEDFNAADKGKLIATNMYNSGADVIYHAAGGTGKGLFAQAKDIKKNDPSKNIWVIGVDRDQHEEGLLEDGTSVTLTSMVKRVDVAVHQVSNAAKAGDFPGGEEVVFGFKDDGVLMATTNADALGEDIIKAAKEWEEKIVSGEIEVPKTREELKDFEKDLK